jgi:hypothetical protein
MKELERLRKYGEALEKQGESLKKLGRVIKNPAVRLDKLFEAGVEAGFVVRLALKRLPRKTVVEPMPTDESLFWKMVGKVGEIDSDAGDWLKERADRGTIKKYSRLSMCFPWHDSPQGYDYWEDIRRQLPGDAR